MQATGETAGAVWLIVDGQRDTRLNDVQIVTLHADPADRLEQGASFTSALGDWAAENAAAEGARSPHLLLVARDPSSRHVAVFVAGTLEQQGISSSAIQLGSGLQLEILDPGDEVWTHKTA